jgi:hypothetical protein
VGRDPQDALRRAALDRESPAAPAMAETAQRAICSDAPPRYARARAGSKLDPFKDEIERCCVRTRGCRACGCLSAVRGRFLGAPLVWADLLFFHSGGEGCKTDHSAGFGARRRGGGVRSAVVVRGELRVRIRRSLSVWLFAGRGLRRGVLVAAQCDLGDGGRGDVLDQADLVVCPDARLVVDHAKRSEGVSLAGD